jgi:hypothetical protein
MSLFISSVFTYDEDAGNYIQAVETADTQALEPATRKAINNFVIGCKQDGIWTAIKASCILSGARTLAGALVPIAGTAPTSLNFVDGDYNRKTGLVGDGSTKYLNSNRNNNADPQNNQHLSVYINTAGTSAINEGYIGCGLANNGASHIFRSPTNNGIASRSRNGSPGPFFGSANDIGLIGISRSAAGSYIQRNKLVDNTVSLSSQTPLDQSIVVFGRNQVAQTNARIAFYSIGESLDLARLDARVTDLINAFAVTIP